MAISHRAANPRDAPVPTPVEDQRAPLHRCRSITSGHARYVPPARPPLRRCRRRRLHPTRSRPRRRQRACHHRCCTPQLATRLSGRRAATLAPARAAAGSGREGWAVGWSRSRRFASPQHAAAVHADASPAPLSPAGPHSTGPSPPHLLGARRRCDDLRAAARKHVGAARARRRRARRGGRHVARGHLQRGVVGDGAVAARGRSEAPSVRRAVDANRRHGHESAPSSAPALRPPRPRARARSAPQTRRPCRSP